MTQPTIYYKIRSKSNPQLYRLGGVDERYNKSGKVWDTLGKLRAFLTMVASNEYRSNNLSNFEIIEFEVKELGTKDPHEVMSANTIKKMLMK